MKTVIYLFIGLVIVSGLGFIVYKYMQENSAQLAAQTIADKAAKDKAIQDKNNFALDFANNISGIATNF